MIETAEVIGIIARALITAICAAVFFGSVVGLCVGFS